MQGDFVVEYMGEVIDVPECRRRLKFQEEARGIEQRQDWLTRRAERH